MLSALGSCLPPSSSANTFRSVSGGRHSLDKNKYVHKHIRNKRCSSCVVHVISNTLLARCASCKKHLMHDTCKARQALWTKKPRLVTTALFESGKNRRASSVYGCISTANGALLGLKPHSGESLRIARRINCLGLSPIDNYLPSERSAVCSKGRKGAHK